MFRVKGLWFRVSGMGPSTIPAVPWVLSPTRTKCNGVNTAGCTYSHVCFPDCY